MSFRRLALALCAALPLAATALAQDAPPVPPAAETSPADDPVRAAWAEMSASAASHREALVAKDEAKAGDAKARYAKAQQRFLACFAKADWKAYAGKADDALVAQGLYELGMGATFRGDAREAIRAWEAFVARFPSHPFTPDIRVVALPKARLAAGDVATAAATWEAHLADPQPHHRGAAHLLLGDVRAAEGDLEKARALWKVAAEIPTPAGDKDPAVAPKRDAETRLALVGMPMPEIEVRASVGIDAKSLSELRGKVVVLEIFHTWCEVCRGMAPALDALQREKGAAGVVVLGLTYPHPRGGFVPGKDGAPGRSVATPNPEAFVAHLKEYRDAAGVGYPFAVAPDATVEKTFRVRGFPTLYVVGRDGRIVFLKVGAADETLLRMAIDRALAAK